MGICFLGTPHRGASIAALGETVYRISKLWGKSPNLSILQSLKYDAETLDRVQSSFKLSLIDRRCKLRIRSFREARKTKGVTVCSSSAHRRVCDTDPSKIVDRFSSVIEDPMEVVSDIDADHSNMTKFDGPNDPGFVSLCSALYRWVEEIKDIQGNREYPRKPLQSPPISARPIQSLALTFCPDSSKDERSH